MCVLHRRAAEHERVETDTGTVEQLQREPLITGRGDIKRAEIRDTAIDAPALFQTSGKAGRLNFSVRHGEKIKCEFDNTTEMTEAIHLLALLLNSTLKVNVEWNGEKQRFERKKTI